MSNNDWIRIIHVAKKETGIDDAAYRAILSGVGIDSSKDIRMVDQFNTIMNAFKNLGFRYNPRSSTAPGAKRKPTVPGVPGYITKRQEYYIRGLWQLASRVKDDKSLKSLIKRIGKTDDISFLQRTNASSVILALRDICWKAGFNPDYKDNGDNHVLDSHTNG